MRLLGDRSAGTVARALADGRYYRALWRMARGAGRPVDFFRRYVLGRGEYPCVCGIRTPIGQVRPTLYSSHDVLTLNEVFFRGDYESPADVRVVVDVGSNIGLSALYFLTRNREVRVYLFEPNPTNAQRLVDNLAGFEDRYVLSREAVGVEDGVFDFGVEETGRYGGIGVATGRWIQVRCREINAVLDEIVAAEGHVDILKIDTEGLESRTVRAVRPDLLDRIDRIYFEAPEGPAAVNAPRFRQRRHGTVETLVVRKRRG
jgi:FkbM family methyltransferase